MAWWRHLYRRAVYGRPIVVVSGLPRSGTSMMMRMLEAGGVPVWTDNVRQPDDQNPHGYYELERIKELDKSPDRRWVREGRGRAVKVISSLLEYLPDTNNYQVLFMNRPLTEVLASQEKMLAQRGVDQPSAESLAAAFEAHLRRVKSLLAHDPRFIPLDVAFTDVLADPASMACRVRDFLGADLAVDRMCAVVDETLYRNRAGGRAD